MLLAFVFGSIVGVSLGLTGGGGSIFAVPLLVYGLGFAFRQAVGVSLGVVGGVAAFGALLHHRRGELLWGPGIMLGLGGITLAPFGAHVGAFVSDRIALTLFALLMCAVGYLTARGRREGSEIPLLWARCERNEEIRPRFSIRCASKLLIAGGIVGGLSGFFGVGGGFLLVPALLIVLALPFERALATSLVAITLISLSGFLAHSDALAEIDVGTVGVFLGGALTGMVLGIKIKPRFSGVVLRRIFGVITFLAAFVVLTLNVVNL